MPTDDNASRIALAHDQLTAKLTELRRREARVRTVVAPLRYLANPWVGVAVAAFVGYRIGRPSGARAEARPAVAAAPESIAHAIVRAGVVVIAQSLARRAFTALVDEKPDEP